jgi:hypothetical protein
MFTVCLRVCRNWRSPRPADIHTTRNSRADLIKFLGLGSRLFHDVCSDDSAAHRESCGKIRGCDVSRVHR